MNLSPFCFKSIPIRLKMATFARLYPLEQIKLGAHVSKEKNFIYRQ